MFKKSKSGWTKHIDFILIDLLILQLSFWLAYFFRENSIHLLKNTLYRNMALIIALLDMLWILMFDIYKNVLQRKKSKELLMTLNQTCGIICGMTVYMFMTQQGEEYSRVILCITAVGYIILNIPSREILKKIVKNKNKKGKEVSLYIVTTAQAAPGIIENIREHNNRKYTIRGIILVSGSEDSICGVPVVSDLAHAKEYLKQEWVDEILIHVPDSQFPSKLKEQCMIMGIVVHTKIPGSLDMDEGTQFIQRVGSQTVLTSSINSMSTTQAAIKRTVDILGSAFGCILTGILFCFIGPLIYIESPGPIIFSQVRVGYNGKKFKIYKFRSMYPDAEERKAELQKENRVQDGHMFKMDFDPRVIGNKILPNGKKKTGIGNFIRKTSIDEFPQFFNVLKGDMSLVGTRPPTVEEVETYDLHHKSRLSTKPGITGLWQVSGRSQITDFEKVVELDTDYIKNWSLALDAKILLKTVKVVLCGRGSM